MTILIFGNIMTEDKVEREGINLMEFVINLLRINLQFIVHC